MSGDNQKSQYAPRSNLMQAERPAYRGTEQRFEIKQP